MASIFEERVIFVKEKVRYFKFGEVFEFFNLDNVKIGEAREENVSFIKKILKMTGLKTKLSFTVSLYDTSNNKIITIKRPFTWFLSDITVFDQVGNKLGRYKEEYQLFKPVFSLYSKHEIKFAKIEGNFVAWNFVITSVNGEKIGEINKKFAGIAKEMFTTADNYLVKLNNSLSEDNRKVLTSVACVIDLICKEYK